MKKSVKILMIVLILIIVGLVTFIVVDKVLNNKKENNTEVTIEENETTNEILSAENESDEVNNESSNENSNSTKQNTISNSNNTTSTENTSNQLIKNGQYSRNSPVGWIVISNSTTSSFDFELHVTTAQPDNYLSGNMNLGEIGSGKAYKVKENVYKYEHIDEYTNEKHYLTFTFAENTVKIEESEGFSESHNGYGASFIGTYVYGIDEIGYIILNDQDVKSNYFIKTWNSSVSDSQIAIYEDGTFVKDNYTASSEIKGTYKIDGVNIEFTTENGEKWNAQMVMEQSGNYVLKGTIDGVYQYFSDPLAED